MPAVVGDLHMPLLRTPSLQYKPYLCDVIYYIINIFIIRFDNNHSSDFIFFSYSSHDDDDDGGTEVYKLSETLRSVPNVPVDVPEGVPEGVPVDVPVPR